MAQVDRAERFKALKAEYEKYNAPPDDGPSPMEWEEYEPWLRQAYAEFLSSDPPEDAAQAFLEQHPSLVPSPFPTFNGTSGGHGPFPDAVIAQPPLQGLGKRIPDFMWLTRNTALFYPVLVEIEAPTKRWFSKGRPSAHLTAALDQFREWREWFNVPANVQTFFDSYRVPLIFRRRKFMPLYVLVYGRRTEGPEEVGKLRAEFQRADQFLMTFDHLEPHSKARDFITVRARGDGGPFTATAMPPTARLNPTYVEDWTLIRGRDQVIQANEMISPERKAYLLERLAAWDAWAAQRGEDGSLMRSYAN
jgi:hypothetical protein